MATAIKKRIQVSKKKLKASVKKAKAFVKKPKNRKYIIIAVVVIVMYIAWKKFGKTTTKPGAGGPGTKIPGTGGGTQNPGTNFPVREINADGAKGSYSATKAGRTITFSRSGELELAFNDDGTISDATPGLNKSGAINTLGGDNVFYMLGYHVFADANGAYNKLQNLYLPDGIYSIRQFVCRPDRIPSLAAFKAGINGWGGNGVNMENARISEVYISVFSDNKQGNGVAPPWLKVSRHLIFTSALQFKNWAAWDRFFCTGYINLGDNQKKYQDIGVLPYILLGDERTQPETWHCAKVAHDHVVTEQEAYGLGQHFIQRMGSSRRSVLTSEFWENAQGKDPDGYGKSFHTYKGAMDELRSKGITNPRTTGLYGEYGGDDFTGLFASDTLFGERQVALQALSSHVHKGRDVNGWGGDHPFYHQGHINHRNVNAKYYFWNKEYFLPYEFLFINERIKVGTKTYQGQDRERNVSIFSCDKVESFVANQAGNKIGIEQARTGEIIPFEGGEILTKMNTQPPVPWDELFTAGLWSTLLTGGIEIWDAPGSAFGGDTSKLHWWSDQQIRWRRNGGDWENYVSGQNGAPENSHTGITHSLFASPIDAAAAGMEVVWEIRNRIQSIKHVAYQSNRGGFAPTPGSAGHNLNGFGPLNLNQFTVKDLVDQKKAMSLDCNGTDGGAIVYYNGFLAPHEFEDVTVKGISFRAYGRQTVIKLY